MGTCLSREKEIFPNLALPQHFLISNSHFHQNFKDIRRFVHFKIKALLSGPDQNIKWREKASNYFEDLDTN